MRLVIVGLLALAVSGASQSATSSRVGGNWTRFGYDAARSNSGPARTGITAASVGKLRRQQVRLPGTADSSPIYLRGVRVRGRAHDVFFVTTSYGITVAVDARTGKILWRFKPHGYASWAGSDRITNSSPIADPSRRYVYAEAPSGRVYKLTVASGRAVWSVSITKLPSREKLGTPLNFSRGLLIATTGGYIGDAPPYQGHVVTIFPRRGRIDHVWNSLCSDRHRLIAPSSCPQSDSAIWARSGAVVVPGSGNLLLATGNARFDGARYWGDSVLMLSPSASRLLHSWTPRNQSELNSGDVDLGSTAPAVLGSGFAAQSGKDGLIRLLKLPGLGGLGRLGGELQTIQAPGGSGVFSTMAVSRGRLFVGTDAGVWCYELSGGRLQIAWKRDEAGTSPVLAGGLLYVYDPNGGLNVFNPATGAVVARLRAGGGHWESPIVTDGRIALPEGDANEHRTSGVLNIYR
jgi:outer membrane protein assembly factor BamB